jgi:4-oxalocrotonate tautomerase
MPVITVKTWPLTVEQKSRLIAEYTRITCEVTGLPPQAMFVYVQEFNTDSIGVSGEPLSKMKH